MGDSTHKKRYSSGAIALDFIHSDPTLLYEHAQRIIPTPQIHLVHVLNLDSCAEREDFEPSCLEQEYWRSEAQLREVGDDLGIPAERQSLLVGSVCGQISDYVEQRQLEALVLGTFDEHKVENYPIDVISGALCNTRCDLLLVK